MLVENTPFELHNGIWVKREDLCSPFPGPSFSKIRGVLAHIRKQRASVIGVSDTVHSKAGWGVSWICHNIGKRAVVYWAQRVGETELRRNQREAEKFGALLIPVPSSRLSIMYAKAKAHLAANWPNESHMIPMSLKLSETVEETARQVSFTPIELLAGTWIICVASGTIAAGVLRGLDCMNPTPRVILHLCSTRGERNIRRYIDKMVALALNYPYRVIDEGYCYKDVIEYPCPFPCNPYYDLKAWKWLMEHRQELTEPIIFWNIGS